MYMNIMPIILLGFLLAIVSQGRIGQIIWSINVYRHMVKGWLIRGTKSQNKKVPWKLYKFWLAFYFFLLCSLLLVFSYKTKLIPWIGWKNSLFLMAFEWVRWKIEIEFFETSRLAIFKTRAWIILAVNYWSKWRNMIYFDYELS